MPQLTWPGSDSSTSKPCESWCRLFLSDADYATAKERADVFSFREPSHREFFFQLIRLEREGWLQDASES